MSGRKYNLFATVVFRHEYFNLSGNAYKDFAVMPTQRSLQIMQQYQLVFRPGVDGFSLYYIGSEGTPSHLERLKGFVRLSFKLTNRNPYFLNFTELPFYNQSIQQFYFSNLDKTAKDEVIPLENAKNGKVSIEDLYEVKPKIFDVPVEGKNGTETIRVFNEFGEKVIEESFADGAKLPPKYTVNLSQQDDGLYWLMRNDQSEQLEMGVIESPDSETILIAETDTNTNEIEAFLSMSKSVHSVFGTLDLFIGDTGRKGSYIVKDEIITPVTYSINFKNRSTFWRYLLMPESPPKYKDFQITGDDSVKFKKEKLPELLSDGREALVFTSDRALELKSGQSLQFQLKMKKIGTTGSLRNSKPIPVTLPNPDYKNVKPVTADKKTYKVYSEMYVQL